MKHLVATTALALILGAPAMADVQDEAAQDQVAQEQTVSEHGFLQRLERGDILDGELIGQDVYAASENVEVASERHKDDPEETATVPEDEEVALDDEGIEDEPTPPEELTERERMAEMRTIDPAQLEEMDNIGQVSGIVIDQDGQVKAVVIGVGGFLGIGEHEVALEFDRVTFAVDQGDPMQYYLIADTAAELLEAAPEFDHNAMRDAMLEEARVDEEERVAEEEELARADEQRMAEEEREAQWRGDREAFTAPDVEREGFERAAVGEISLDTLIGSDVYDVLDENIGSINDVIIGNEGEVGYVVVDIGGFLGFGTHTVALGLDEVAILHAKGWDEFRLYVDATQEQLEGMPEYAQAN